MACTVNHNTVNRQEFTISVKHTAKNINLIRFNIVQIKQQFSPIMTNLVSEKDLIVSKGHTNSACHPRF
jgi:hypothetical protein